MGTLDEAIREHLDLRLRHGADPDEVAKQEGEVFGPPRRGDADVAVYEELAGPAADVGEGAPVDDVAEQQTHLRLAEEAPPPREMPAEPELAAKETHEHPQAPPPEPLGQETRAFDPEEVRAASAAGDDPGTEEERDADDVLEETPEFLAETPEHDRLWFEQRPPRDFDF